MALGPFLLNCDTGRDDALTIWLAAGLGLPLQGVVASYGNTSVENVIDNTARVIALTGRDDLPVLPGGASPSRPHRGFETVVVPRQRAAGNGLCNLVLPPARLPGALSQEKLAESVAAIAEKTGPLDYILLCAATDLAAMCAVWGKDAPRYVGRVTMMGGKLGALWDRMPGADFNVLCDPYALRAVMGSGIPVRFVTMNTTWPVMLPLAEVEALKAGGGKIAQVAKDLMIAHVRHFAPEPVFRFHDPAVLIAALEPAGFRDVRLDVLCDDSAPDFGRLVETPSGFAAQIYDAPPGTEAAFLRGILAGLDLG
jgi:inosine-uridine nucleoside N-ribohydrolase